MTKFKEISVTEVNRLNEKGGNLTLIDVRTPEEFAEIHSVIAINLPLQDFSPKKVLDLGLHRVDHVYLICRSGARSAKACALLNEAGFEHVFNVTGGTLAWDASGLPIFRAKKGA